jgi:hypothetical protein
MSCSRPLSLPSCTTCLPPFSSPPLPSGSLAHTDIDIDIDINVDINIDIDIDVDIDIDIDTDTDTDIDIPCTQRSQQPF